MAPTEEFTTYVFKKNEIKSNNLKVLKERPYYIGVLLFLISIVLYLLDIGYAGLFLVVGNILLFIGMATMSGRRPSLGHRPLTLKLTADSVFIGKERLSILNKGDVSIKISGYRGEFINQRVAFYQTHSGNENVLKIKYQGKVVELKFVLMSETHKDQLVSFCQTNGFPIWTRKLRVRVTKPRMRFP